MKRPIVLLMLLGLAVTAVAQIPASPQMPMSRPASAPTPPDTLTAWLDADVTPAPRSVSLASDSLLIGAPLEIRLDYDGGVPDPLPVLKTDAEWLLLGGTRRSVDGRALLIGARIYRTGPCVLGWQDGRAPVSGVYEIAGRLPGDAQPHAVRDPRTPGYYILRIVGALMLVALLLLALVLLSRRRRPGAGIPEIRFDAPAWMIAARELWAIQEEKLPARGETRLFLHRVDLALRRYLGLRHAMDATEMTSSEVVSILEASAGDLQTPARTGAWLRDCDRLRFASGEVRPEDCQRLLDAAVREIERTRETDCPEDVPGDWRYESELCWSRLLSSLPRLEPARGGGTDA